MRKGQETLLKRAEKHGFPEEYVKCLEREDLSLKRLEHVYRIFSEYMGSTFDKEDIIQLAVYPCLNFYCDVIVYALWKRNDRNEKKDFFPPSRILDLLDDRRIGDGLVKRGFTRVMILTGAGIDEILSLYEKYAERFREAEEIYCRTDGTQIWNTPAYRWFEIITGEYCNDGNIFSNFPLREEYAEAAYGDETLTCTDAEYAIRNNIPVKLFRECGYDRTKYLYHCIPCMELLPVDIRNQQNNYVFETKIEKMELLESVSDLLRNRNEPLGIRVNQIPSNTIEIKADTNCFKITLTHYTGVFYNPDQNQWCHTSKEHIKIKLVLFLNGKIYEDRKIRGALKLVPLSVKRLCMIRNIFGEYGKSVYEFLVNCSTCMLNTPVMKDIDRQIQKSSFFLPPVTINDCENVHNLNQLLKDKWKNGHRVNWNKTDVNLGYMMVRSAAIIPERDRAKLFEIRDPKLVPDEIRDRMIYRREFGCLFLADYILGKIGGCPPDKEKTYRFKLRDYMTMCRELKTPVKTGFRSLKKIEDAHDKTVKAYSQKKNIHKVKIPKNSQFNPLRKLLPSDFEWIRSGKRLYEEGVMMGHCVNSYYYLINKDISAIYSFIHEGKRYTAEFCVNKKGCYYINQIQSRYDRGCPNEVWKMVKGLIS